MSASIVLRAEGTAMRRLVALCTIVVGLAVTSGTASAGGGLLSGLVGGGCGATAPAFLPWGDWSSYYLAPNGGFEAGAFWRGLSGGAGGRAPGKEPRGPPGVRSARPARPPGGGAPPP